MNKEKIQNKKQEIRTVKVIQETGTNEIKASDVVVINSETNEGFRLKDIMCDKDNNLSASTPFIYSDPMTTRYLAIEGENRIKALREILDEDSKYKLGNFVGYDSARNIIVSDCIDATYRFENIVRFFF